MYEISPLDVEEYKKKRVKQVLPATVSREITCLKHIFNKAREWGKIEGNPIASVKLFNIRDRRVRYLEKEEIARLVHACPEYMKPIVIVALNTGMRKSEIFNLKWNDIDFRNHFIYVLETKNNEARKIPMNDITFRALLKVRKNAKSPHVFLQGKRGALQGYPGWVQECVKESRGKNFRFHDLRYTFASHLVMAGVDLRTVQELLGHKTFEMTLRYARLSPDHKRRAVDILSRRMDTIWTPRRKIKEKVSLASLP